MCWPLPVQPSRQNWSRVLEGPRQNLGVKNPRYRVGMPDSLVFSTPAATVSPFARLWTTLARPRGHAFLCWVLRASFTRPANP